MSTALTKCDRSYPLVHSEMIEATVLPGDQGHSRANSSAELREISPASAKLLVAGPPELPCCCRLRLVSSKLMRTLEIPAEIGWARPNPAGDWLVECEFENRLSDGQFGELLNSGLLERRSAVRFQTRIPVEVRWAEKGPHAAGLIRDLSEGGLCLMTNQAPQNTRDVDAIVNTAAGQLAVRLKVRWTLRVGINHLIGCQFTDGRHFHALRNLPQTSTGLNEYSRACRPREY